MKRFLTLLLILVTVCSPAAMRGGALYDPGAARSSLSNVDATATPSMTSITLSDKVRAAWADILGDIYASGTVKVATGTAAAPAYSFSSDPDTGIYSAGADTLGFGVGGAEAVRISESGGLGVGGVNPVTKFHVKLGDDYNLAFNVEKSPTVASAAIITVFNDAASANKELALQGSALYFRGTSSAERMRITTGGNVLIATSTDDGVNKLQVNGNIKAEALTRISGGAIAVTAGNIATHTITLPTLFGDDFGGSFIVVATISGANIYVAKTFFATTFGNQYVANACDEIGGFSVGSAVLTVRPANGATPGSVDVPSAAGQKIEIIFDNTASAVDVNCTYRISPAF